MKVGSALCMVLALSAAVAVNTANADIIADGTFQNPIGTGLNLTPWSDWTSAGITTAPMVNPLLGNYASMPNSPNGGSDLFQRFTGPALGTYTLSFLAQNASPWAAELVVAIQNPFGGIPPQWLELAQVIDLPASSAFTLYTLTFQATQPVGTQSELTFSNSYDDPNSWGPGLPGNGSINPLGTVMNVAAVAITPTTPLPSSWTMMIAVLLGFGFITYQRRSRTTTV